MLKKIRFTHFELNIHIANKEIRNLHVTHLHFKCEKYTSDEAQKTKCKKCEESFTSFKLNSYMDNKDSRNFRCYSCEVSFIKTDYLQGTKIFNAINVMIFERIKWSGNIINLDLMMTLVSSPQLY